jgi:MYXO-CTERM domain-containing protein
VTHETGHVLGLDHTCVPAGTVPRPTDNLGNPVPDCSTASPDVVATTMFPSAQPGDTQKRDLAPDDQQAVCEIYPAASDPKVCMPDVAGGCTCVAAGHPGAPGPGAIALGLAGLTLLRARRRRGRSR